MFLMLFTHYLFGYVGTILCSIGLIFALCSVYIFTRRQMRSAVATYLAGLSISDSCLLTLGLIIAINSSIPPKQQSELFYSSHIHKYLFPYVYACIIWFQFTSVWITIGFAVDRWFAIKWPMLHYTYSSKRACYIVFTIYCLGFIYSFPRFFEYKTQFQREKLFLMDNLTEDVDYLVIVNKFLHNRLYHYIVHLILYSLFQSILPLLMLSYFNVELIRSINASSNFLKRFTSLYTQNTHPGRRETHTSRYRERTITRSVICLIGLFILCQVPASILHYIHMFYRNHPVLYICYDISNFLILLNSAVNFFIFTYFNRKFRRELARVCFHIRKTRKPILRTTSHQSFLPTNSQARTPTPKFEITSGNSWKYQKRNHRLLLHNESEESINHLKKQSSNISIECKPILTRGRYSFYDSKHQQSQSEYQQRRHSERLAFYRKKPSLTINHGEPNLHYMTYKHEKSKPKSILVYSPMTYSTTISENSSSIEQKKLFKPMLNTTEKSNRYFRK